MRNTYRKVTPAPLRALIGRAVSRSVMLYRDSAGVRATWKNLAPVALSKGLRLGAARPSVTAVFVGRNDDYVADNEARIRAMIEWNSKLLCDEMIFVEWNPLLDRPLLSTALAKDYPHLRAYVVHPDIHARLCDHPRMPVLEEFGKNVGIRRAASEYVCVTNCYIFWDRNVARMGRVLDRNLVFRTRRVELRWDGRVPTQDYLRDPANRIEYRLGWRQELDYGCGDFVLAHRDLWLRAGGYDESLRNQRLYCDGRGLGQLLAHGGKPAHLGFHYHIFHESSSSSLNKGTDPSTLKNALGQSFDYLSDLPYQNPPSWGLADAREEAVAERVWMLKP
jgi:hypothetical protein